MTDLTPLEKSLSKLAHQPGERFAAELRERSLQDFDRYQPARAARKMFGQNRGLVLRLGSALVLVSFILMAFTPPGRALADVIFQLGLMIFTHAPTDIELELTATPAATRESFFYDTIFADPEEAGEKADFPIYHPAFLPEGYYPSAPADASDPLSLIINSSGEVSYVSLDLEHKEHKKILLFSQSPYNPGELPNEPINVGVGDAKLQEVMIDGHKAIWMESLISGTNLDENGQIVPVRYNVLVWEVPIEGGRRLHFYMMSEELLPLDVMLRIAESLEAH